jgi:hypothetical protein
VRVHFKEINKGANDSLYLEMPKEDCKHAIVRLKDETCGPDQEFRVHIFFSRETAFPKLELGYILRLHRLKVNL